MRGLNQLEEELNSLKMGNYKKTLINIYLLIMSP